jgi:Protein of unknown function (DUF1822)
MSIDKRSILFPITRAAIDQAELHCKDLVGTQAQQVRQNTLAVWVVNEYLSLMDVATDLTAGDSWHSVATKLGLDTADLVTDSGKLECRSIVGTVDWEQDHWQQQSCSVPPEVWDDSRSEGLRQRCGYVFVQLDETNQMAEILGFLPEVNQEVVALDQLQVFEDLFDHLYALRTAETVEPATVTPAVNVAINAAKEVMQKTTVLGRWLQDQIEEGWQALDSLTGLTPAYAFRTRQATVEQSQQSSQITIVRRGKEISFGNWDQASEVCQVTLVMGVKSLVSEEASASIELGLYPVLPQVRLPQGLKVQIVDSEGTVFLPAETIDTEELLEFEFGGLSGEEFSVMLEWRGFVLRESFVI